MTNLEKYDNAFVETFQLEKKEIYNLKYQDVDEWDSVGHMALIAALEEAFDILMEMDDILEFSCYEEGKNMVGKYDVEF